MLDPVMLAGTLQATADQPPAMGQRTQYGESAVNAEDERLTASRTGWKAEEPEMPRPAGHIENALDATLLASVHSKDGQYYSDSELLHSSCVQRATDGRLASLNFSSLHSLSAASSGPDASTPLEHNMATQVSDKRSGRLLWPLQHEPQQSQESAAAAPPSPLTVARPETDLLGRPLPAVPPPQDPFAQAVSQQPSFIAASRGRFSSTTGIKSLNLAAFGSSREDDTQSTWASTLFSRVIDRSGETVPEVQRAPPREDGSVSCQAGTSQSAEEVQNEQVGLRRTSTEPEGLAQLAARIDALEAELSIDLPATPKRSYSPSLVASSDSSSPARAARTRLLAQQAGEPLSSSASASRPSLAARRSMQRLPPLLPTSTGARSPFLAPPSDSSSPSVSSLSIRSVPLPPIERGKDGFYRLPTSPHKVAEKAPFDDATSLSFPLPPHLDLTSPALKSATASSLEGSQATPVTPSSFSHPSSPPPRSPPPALPEFVSVFLEPRSSSERATRAEAEDGASEDDLVGGTYPPVEGRSHIRRAESLSSAVVPPLALRYSLRQRTPTQAGWPTSREGKIAGSPSDTGESGPADSKVKWTIRAAPGWSLRAERREAEDSGTVRAVGGRIWSSLRDSRLVRLVAAGLIIATLLLVVGLAVGLTRLRKNIALAKCDCLNGGKAQLTATGDCVCLCRGTSGGTSCHLDGTCLGDLAQGIVDTAARASSLWQPAVNTTRLTSSLRLYSYEDSSTSTGCSHQLALLSIPNLSFTRFPNRVNWIEAALLHIFAESESNSTAARFRTFASRLGYSLFGDEPATTPNSNFQIMPAGYVWDLAALERSVPSVSWNSTVGSGASLSLTPASFSTLDNITSNAIAASRQRTTALAHFWNDTLSLPSRQLDLLRAAVQSAEVLLPFDATTLAQGAYEDATLFPPVAACRSGLNAAAQSGIDSLESTVLGLPPMTTDNSSCSDRPRYGILNLLNLRLPFASVDKRPKLPQQALVLEPADTLRARMSVHAGETLSAGPFAPGSTAPRAPETIEHSGLLAPGASAIDHVLLDYLSLLSVPIAKALVEYLLSNAATLPPAVGSLLWQHPLPTLEVQLWGAFDLTTDVAFAKSGFSTPASSNGSSALFFGSSAGATFRSWALVGTNRRAPLPIVWSPTAESALVANDTGQAEVDAIWAEAASQSLTTTGQVWRALAIANLTS